MENLEFEVLDSFERVLKASLIKELPAFERVFRELQGSADFVGFPHEKLIGTYDFSKLSSLLLWCFHPAISPTPVTLAYS